MKVAVMQPYCFPYLGYFQLMRAADRFVLLDDVAFIRQGWVNRNRVLVDGRPHLFTVPVRHPGLHRTIAETRVAPGHRWRRKLADTFGQAYAAAPRSPELLEDVCALVRACGDDLTGFLRAGLDLACRELGISTAPVTASEHHPNHDGLRGAARIIAICQREGADTYLNAPGGRALYRQETFREAGLRLRFLNPCIPPYPQGRIPAARPFVPDLSIIDVLMWNRRTEARSLLGHYTLTDT